MTEKMGRLGAKDCFVVPPRNDEKEKEDAN